MCCGSVITRRSLLRAAGSSALAAGVAAQSVTRTGSGRIAPVQTPLVVQPVLLYETPKRVPERSWRQWGSIQTEAQAGEEKERISRELAAMGAPFPLKVLPVELVRNSVEQAAQLARRSHDVMLVYAAGGGNRALEALTLPDRWNLLFVRHRSGAMYVWYEIAHPRYLRKTVDEYGQPGMDFEDVIVDRHEDVLMRLRALYAVKNSVGKRIVAVGGASGWGRGGQKAPQLARDIWRMDIREVSYEDLGARIRKARAVEPLVKACRERANRYLADRAVKLETQREYVVNAFVLTEVFRDLLDEHQTDTITINQCMGTIMPISQTTACMPLSILNDEGYMAFCESDFVVIPSGVLLHYLSGKPVFFNDPTYPHHGLVTLAHCTAPRRMDGEHAEPVRLLTHFESDYGAAPKVEMRKGQIVTNLDPDFGGRNWVGFLGEIDSAPFLDICRSQIDVAIKGDCRKLAEEMKGFHWMTCYGDYMQASAYALKKVGVKLTVA